VGKLAVVALLLVLGGAAASYPAWSQLASQLSSSGFLQTSTSSVASSNSTDQTIWENTTEPDIFSLPTDTATDSTTGVPFGAGWVSQVMGLVDSYRGGESLTECAQLDSFAMTRFETMTNGTNWEVTHYGYTQDEGRVFGGSPGIYAEEYFYPTQPSLKTPEGFVNMVMTTAPGHWNDLTSQGFKYYGAYYAGQGPVMLFQSSCGPTELGAGVNVTEAFPGCPSQKVIGAWLVIELSSVCPQ
jgi:hypothetical protein